ncbi:MAG: hypothetical protein M5U26_12105 [Planctomycetota bacterium]|nr:hypothetical protein [Planctomycetota bacterium]
MSRPFRFPLQSAAGGRFAACCAPALAALAVLWAPAAQMLRLVEAPSAGSGEPAALVLVLHTGFRGERAARAGEGVHGPRDQEGGARSLRALSPDGETPCGPRFERRLIDEDLRLPSPEPLDAGPPASAAPAHYETRAEAPPAAAGLEPPRCAPCRAASARAPPLA